MFLRRGRVLRFLAQGQQGHTAEKQSHACQLLPADRLMQQKDAPAGSAQRFHQGQRGGHGRGGAAQPGQGKAEGQGGGHDAQIQGHPHPLGLQQPERRRAEMDGQQQEPAARAEQEHDVLRRVGPAQRLAEDEVAP